MFSTIKDFIPIYVGQAEMEMHLNWCDWNITQLITYVDRWDYFTWFGLRRVNANRRLAAYNSIEKTFKAQGGSILDESEDTLIAKMELKVK